MPLDNSAPGRHAFTVYLLDSQNAKPLDSSVASLSSPIPMACQQDVELESHSMPLAEADVYVASSSAPDDSPAKSSDVEVGACDYITPDKLTIRAQRSSEHCRTPVAKGEHAYSVCNETHARNVVDAIDRKIARVRKKADFYRSLCVSTQRQYGRMLKYLKHLNKLRRLRDLPQVVLSTSQPTKADRKNVFSVATE